jgi:hypothetical protein
MYRLYVAMNCGCVAMQSQYEVYAVKLFTIVLTKLFYFMSCYAMYDAGLRMLVSSLLLSADCQSSAI